MKSVDEHLEEAVEIALRAPIDDPATISDFLNYSVGDAVSLGITLTEKDASGGLKWHHYSDIRADEFEDTEREILRRLLRPVLERIFVDTAQ